MSMSGFRKKKRVFFLATLREEIFADDRVKMDEFRG